jgi:hypothetical protein
MKEEILEMKKEVEEIKQEKEQSDLIRILMIDDKKNKRLCWIIALLVLLLIISVGYIIYLHNDIGTKVITEETETYDYDADNGNINHIGGDNNGEITNS